MACNTKSDYLLSLENEDKDLALRYNEKIRVIQGIDPFCLMGNLVPEEDQEVSDFPSVTAIDIIFYLVLTHGFYTKEQMKTYKSLAAYRYFEDGFVQKCKSQKIGEHMVVFGQVKNSQRMKDQLKVWIICQSQGSIISAHCTCMAGTSEASSEVCGHVGAILYTLENMHQATRNLSPIKMRAIPKEASSSSIIPAIEGEELVKFLQEIQDKGDDAAIMRIVEPFASQMSQDRECT